ncbi:hypothetical protein [Pedobacter changchengzhani]|uniref:hypothetical protein n=1 Tax=Pedobacter changchengzhani TaxID=2529274 RepID=UPI001404CA2A|nr:hypothetical protein [Pedobacter changchengzhani]
MKNQEIKSNSVALQSKKEWVKPEILSEDIARTLSGSISGGAEGVPAPIGSYHS